MLEIFVTDDFQLREILNYIQAIGLSSANSNTLEPGQRLSRRL